MTNKEIADLIFSHITKDTEYYKNLYKDRNLSEGAIVTRYAPSPTGFIHMGALYASLICKKVAHDTNGIFFLRIEDTDKKREVEDGVSLIIKDLKDFGISFDEGVTLDGEKGNYGPYIQSKRKEIYQAFIKELLINGDAYVSFAKEEELEKIRKLQESTKSRLGYYGPYATDRNLTNEEVYERIKNGEEFVIRLKSKGDFNRKVIINDLVKGKVEMPENDLDVVIMKKDGLPTYHFAHAVDDTLMHTTHVIRGDEWLSSAPIHVELFKAIGAKVPKYAHISPLMKEDNGNKRKLSKRKDPEAAVSYYEEVGIPKEAVITYLMTVANSNFEEFMMHNKDKTMDDFKFDFKKMSKSGALFDLEKLKNISKNYLSTLKAEEIYENLANYTKKHDEEFYNLITLHKEDTINTLNIERNCKKPRKDFESYSTVRNSIWYMYDELYKPEKFEFNVVTDKEEIINIMKTYMEKYFDSNDTQEVWFDKMKDLASKFGYAREVKEYKNNPDSYKGHVGDISMVLRVSITSKSMTPNLYDIMQILGKDRILKRIEILEKEYN